MRVLLVVGSVGRVGELTNLLTSIRPAGVEVTVRIVEQRDRAGVSSLVDRLELPFAVEVLGSQRGLSRARNVALADLADLRDVDWIGYPDDDCIYAPDTLGALCEQASLCPDADVLVGRQLSRRGQPTLDTPDSRVEVTRRNVWRLAMSSAIFVRPRVHRLVGVFNPMIGVGLGTPLGSGEETDLVLRAMDHGLRCVFVPEIEVQHPNRSEAANGPTVARGWSYGVGMGGVLRSNGYSGLSAGRAVLRPAVGCLVAALAGDLALAGFRAAGAAGRAYGYLFRWSIVDEERSSSADGAVRRRTLHLPGGSGYGSDRSV